MEQPLTKADRAAIRKVILEQMKDLAAQLETYKKSTSSGDRLADESDVASRNTEEAVISKLLSRCSKQLRIHNLTLSAVNSEDFGVCEKCADDIGLKRLLIRPTATLCLPCAQSHELAKKRHKSAQMVKTGFADFQASDEPEKEITPPAPLPAD